MSWPAVQLGLVITFIRGITFKPSDVVEPNTPGSVVVMRTKNVQVAGLDIDDLIAVSDSFVKRDELYLTEGDILISSANSWELVGKSSYVDKLDFSATAGGFISIVRPVQSLINARYLYHWMTSPSVQHDIRHCGRQTTNISNMDVGRFKNLEIPLPPLAEQQRIAAILDKADALRRKRQQAIDLADQYLRSVFLDMFGDPVSNPKGWEELPLAHGIKSIESGWSASGDNAPATMGQLGVLKISAVTSGFFRSEENKAVEVSNVPVGKKLLKPRAGDLLFSRANTRELVAATAIVNQDYDNLFLPDKLWRVDTNEKLLPEFLHFLLKQPRMRDRLTSQATGTSGSMLNISKKKFEETPAIFPPADAQFRFAEVFRKTREVGVSEGRSAEELNLLFNSLSQQAFGGQL